jgi:RimJ/RimL family protein N-acetyltransferase
MQQDVNALGQPIGFLIPDWKPPGFPSREPMDGRFCRLEPLRPELHAAALHEANAADAEGRMWTYLPYGPFATFENYRRWIDDMSKRSDPMFFAIIDRTHGKPVGVAGFLRMDAAAGSIEVGHLAFSPLLQRTIAATEAMFLMMERAFSLGYRRYEWKCDALNAPSRRAAQRLGFSFEGIFRQATVVKGRNRDTAWFSIIDRDWPKLKDAFQRWLEASNFDESGRQRLSLSALVKSFVADSSAQRI